MTGWLDISCGVGNSVGGDEETAVGTGGVGVPMVGLDVVGSDVIVRGEFCMGRTVGSKEVGNGVGDGVGEECVGDGVGK